MSRFLSFCKFNQQGKKKKEFWSEINKNRQWIDCAMTVWSWILRLHQVHDKFSRGVKT
jgi:hypothetical protein